MLAYMLTFIFSDILDFKEEHSYFDIGLDFFFLKKGGGGGLILFLTKFFMAIIFIFVLQFRLFHMFEHRKFIFFFLHNST